MVDIVKELETERIVLLLVPPFQYHPITVDILRQLQKQKLCYVCMNKTYLAMREDLTREGVDVKNVAFIDAISKTIKQTGDVPDKNVCCVSSPAALTEISLAISEFMRRGYAYFIFDSLNDFLIYEKKAPVSQFILNLVNKLRESDARVIFYAVTIDENSAVLKQVGMFVDKDIEMQS